MDALESELVDSEIPLERYLQKRSLLGVRGCLSSYISDFHKFQYISPFPQIRITGYRSSNLLTWAGRWWLHEFNTREINLWRSA